MPNPLLHWTLVLAPTVLLACGDENRDLDRCLDSFDRYADRTEPGVSCNFEFEGSQGCSLEVAVPVAEVQGRLSAGCYRDASCLFQCTR